MPSSPSRIPLYRWPSPLGWLVIGVLAAAAVWAFFPR